MAINALQPTLRGATGKELQLTGDFHAYWDQLGIPPGQFAERMAAWKALPQNAAWIDATEDADAAVVVGGLWRNGEQGIWLDAGDLLTMFQDASGTLPVYAPGQGQVDPPVGLLLDKRKGLERGPELLTNGDFSAGAANWAVTNNDATHSATFASGALRFKVDSLTPALTVSQPSVLVPGRWYEVTVAVSAWTSGTVKTDVFAQASAVLASGTGTFTTRLLAVSSVFSFTRGAPTVDLTIDSISIRELSGNHAYQTTTTSRPTLSARYNLLTNTSFAGAIAGAPGTAPTGWVFGFSTGEITAVTPLGPDFAVQIAASATRLIFTQQLIAAPNVAYSHWIDVLETTGITAIDFIALTSPPAGATTTYFFNGEPITSSTVISSPGRLEMRMPVGSTGGNYYVRFGVGCSGNTTGIATIARPDVRVTNDGIGLPPYQRVVDANTYDTVGFPLYLRFDGVDDFLQTANVDFSGTGVVTMATAYRKLSDAAVGEIFALSGSPTASSGTFGFYTPESANGTAAAVFFARGASSIISGQRLGAAPISCVAGGWVSISMPYMRYRINQGSSLTSSAATGGGNFGNYPLYIGRRSGTSFPFNGRLYSLLVRGTATPDATIAQVERHLNQKARIY